MMVVYRIILAFWVAVLFGTSFGASVAQAEQVVPSSQGQINLSYAPVVKRATPAVVNVYAERHSRQQAYNPFGNDDFFRHFFGNRGFGMPRQRVEKALGSGVIVDGDGYIVTNNHVIDGATDIKVVLHDRRELVAKLILADDRTDLAILKVDTGGKALPSLPLGNSDQLDVGDLVLAIGNPFGVGQTVTSGIVSALARTQVVASDYQFFIQTDAAINPGNSGGALVNMKGELIGINTAIFSRSGGSVGIGFAVPVNMVRSVIYSARSDGKIVRPWSGARLQKVTQDIATSLKMARPTGALVAQLHKQSPLAKAGLRRGDVIIMVDGVEINSPAAFDYRFVTARIGADAAVVVRRSDGRHQFKVARLAAPETTPRNETVLAGRTPLTGLKVVNLSPAVAEEMHLPSTVTGVVVVAVTGGPAARVGFAKGDIVVDINGDKITNIRRLQEVLGKDSRGWTIVINRGGRLNQIRIAR